MDDRAFTKLIEYLEKIPAIHGTIGKGAENGLWWVKFDIDINHEFTCVRCDPIIAQNPRERTSRLKRELREDNEN